MDLMEALIERFTIPDVDVNIDAKLLSDEAAKAELRIRNRSTRMKVQKIKLGRGKSERTKNDKNCWLSFQDLANFLAV